MRRTHLTSPEGDAQSHSALFSRRAVIAGAVIFPVSSEKVLTGIQTIDPMGEWFKMWDAAQAAYDANPEEEGAYERYLGATMDLLPGRKIATRESAARVLEELRPEIGSSSFTNNLATALAEYLNMGS